MFRVRTGSSAPAPVSAAVVLAGMLVALASCGGGGGGGTHKLTVELRFRHYGGGTCTGGDGSTQLVIRDAANKILASATPRYDTPSPVQPWEVNADNSAGDCVSTIREEVADSGQYQFALSGGFRTFPVQSRQQLAAQEWHLTVSLDINGSVIVKS